MESKLDAKKLAAEIKRYCWETLRQGTHRSLTRHVREYLDQRGIPATIVVEHGTAGLTLKIMLPTTIATVDIDIVEWQALREGGPTDGPTV